MALSHFEFFVAVVNFWGSSQITLLRRLEPTVWEQVQQKVKGSLARDLVASIISFSHLGIYGGTYGWGQWGSPRSSSKKETRKDEGVVVSEVGTGGWVAIARRLSSK